MNLRISFYIILLFTGIANYQAFSQQNLSNVRSKKIALNADTITIDSLSIIPGSLVCTDRIPPFYLVDYNNAHLIILQKKGDSAAFQYRVFPFKIGTAIMHKDSSKMTLAPQTLKQLNKGTTDKEDIFNTGGLNKGGSISRGINFGNNQDLTVNSNLNLQLSGKIYDDIEVMAAISDNTVPIQADGNSQQLQEFDKVYIQFKKNNTKLLTGDFQIQETQDRFLRFNKKAQGLSFSSTYPLSTTKSGFQILQKTDVDLAISKGKFSRYQINGIEGNQGPYKLKGAENESFIVILSGTEKIYVDGKLLARGQDNEYVIDYNNAEITFTSQQIITKDKRIIVEFQYSDKNFTRTLMHAKNEVTFEKAKIAVNIYSEQDVKSQPLQQELSSNQIKVLQDVGDSIQYAVSPNIDTIAFSPNYVLYEKKDTTVNANTYSIYQYSTDATKAKYRLTFGDFGQGKGNYVFANNSVNGRTFQWVAPVNGVPQGRYEPQTLLITPKQRQMATVNAQYKPNKNTMIGGEVAASNRNINLFSDKDKSDDKGLGFNFHLENLYRKDSSKWSITTNADYQLILKNFYAIERFRSTEFERDWNILSLASINETEQLASVKAIISNGSTKSITLHSSYFTKANLYHGWRSNTDFSFKNKVGTTWTGTASYLQSGGTLSSSQFFRYNTKISQNLGWLNVGISAEQDHNKIFDPLKDTLLKTSFIYTQNGLFIQSNERIKNTFSLTYNQRTDYGSRENSMHKSTVADNLEAKMAFPKNKFFQLTFSSTYRALNIVDTTVTATKKPENTLLNRIDINFNLFKSFITSRSYYEFGSGLEIKREYSFIEVAAGQGVYSWIDYNGDGVQQLNEFEIAKFSDQAKFLKIYTPTNEYIKTYSTQFNEVLNIQFSQLFKNQPQKNLQKFVSKFHNQLAYRTQMKKGKTTIENAYLPYSRTVNDTTLISTNNSFRNTLFFNRANPIYGIDFTFTKNENKILLTSGVESRSLQSKALNFRWNFTQKWSILLTGEEQIKSKFSQFFSTNDYQIHSYIVLPKLSFQPNNNLRITALYNHKEKSNNPTYGVEKANVNQIGTELTYNFKSKGRLDCTFNYIAINYSKGTVNSSPLDFEMLEGLNVGNNLTWSVSIQSRLANNMQVNLNYSGRSSSTNAPIHNGGVQVQMLF